MGMLTFNITVCLKQRKMIMNMLKIHVYSVLIFNIYITWSFGKHAIAKFQINFAGSLRDASDIMMF